MLVLPSLLPPIMYRSLSFLGKLGSSLIASARFVSGPMATSETCVSRIVFFIFLVFRLLRKAALSDKRSPHLVRIFSHQSDHCVDCMLLLKFAMPLRVFVFDHIPKSISSKVVTSTIASSYQGTTRTSKHWHLQRKTTVLSLSH